MESFIYFYPYNSNKMNDPNIRINQKDRMIIEHLIGNARISLSDVAKSIKLSKSSTHNRLNTLIKKGIINNFVPIIDFKKLGYSINIIFLKSNASEDAIKELESLDFYLSINTTSSFNNLIITTISKSLEEFRTQLSLLYKITKYRDIKVFNILEYDTPIYNLFGIKVAAKKRKERLVKIDKTDIKILEALKEDARIPAIKISTSLNIDSKTVINRVRKMEDGGIIKKYHTIFNSSKLGFHPYNIIFKVKEKEFVGKLYGFIKNYPFCYLAVQLDGEYDLIGTFVFDNNKLHEFLKKLHESFKNIAVETEVMMLFEFKNKFLPKKVILDLT